MLIYIACITMLCSCYKDYGPAGQSSSANYNYWSDNDGQYQYGGRPTINTDENIVDTALLWVRFTGETVASDNPDSAGTFMYKAWQKNQKLEYFGDDHIIGNYVVDTANIKYDYYGKHAVRVPDTVRLLLSNYLNGIGKKATFTVIGKSMKTKKYFIVNPDTSQIFRFPIKFK